MLNLGRPLGTRRPLVLATYQRGYVLGVVEEHHMMGCGYGPGQVVHQHREEPIFPLNAVEGEEAKTHRSNNSKAVSPTAAPTSTTRTGRPKRPETFRATSSTNGAL